jgi:hypothetical protein
MTTGGKHPTYDDIAANTLRSGMSIDERDSLLLSALNILAGSFGFIRRDWSLSGRGGHLLSSSGFSPEGIARKCGHAITEPGRRFLQSVMIEE